MTPTRVYVASPFMGATVEETRQNIVYARLCMLDSLRRGEAPYLSHLLYTQVYPEDAASREVGLLAGDAWREVAEIVAIYTDLGVTAGMQRAINKSRDGTCVGRNIEPSRLHGVDLADSDFSTPNGWRILLAVLPLDDFPALSLVSA